jgi:hypothetical protein
MVGLCDHCVRSRGSSHMQHSKASNAELLTRSHGVRRVEFFYFLEACSLVITGIIYFLM